MLGKLLRGLRQPPTPANNPGRRVTDRPAAKKPVAQKGPVSAQQGDSGFRFDGVDGRTIDNIADLPPYHQVLTGPGGVINTGSLSGVAVLKIDDCTNRIILLAEQQTTKDNAFFSFRARVKGPGLDYHIERQLIASAGLIAALNNLNVAQQAAKDTLGGDDKNEIKRHLSRMSDAAIASNVSDIHLCLRKSSDVAEQSWGTILFRLDSMMEKWERLPYDNIESMVSYMYTFMADEKSRSEPTFNPRQAQSCMVPLHVDRDLQVNLRYQSTPCQGGYDVVLRLLKIDQRPKANLTLEMLGYSPSHCRDLDLAVRKSVGSIIVAGVTGSGKSTTLKTLMTMSPDRHKKKYYSIEDPVEYKIFGVTQISVQRSANGEGSDGFKTAMRVVMRADPDTIMVGEIRDSETGSFSKTMVQSGHQVMTTVHATSATGIISRMSSEEIGLSREVMAEEEFISALIYQRLVPKLCPDCKIPAKGALDERRLNVLKTKFGIAPDGVRMCNFIEPEARGHAAVCKTCGGRGVKGQTVVAEIILPDSEFRKLVREGKMVEAREYWQWKRSAGFGDDECTGKTAFEHGLLKVAQGIVSPLHLEDAFEPFELYQICHKPTTDGGKRDVEWTALEKQFEATNK